MIGLFWAKYARRIFAIVSTTSIPNPAPVSPTEATVDPPSRGSRLDADHPENGVLIPYRFTPCGGWLSITWPVNQADGKRPSKQEKVIEMLRRPEGATVDEVVRATGWQRHTVRGVFLVRHAVFRHGGKGLQL